MESQPGRPSPHHDSSLGLRLYRAGLEDPGGPVMVTVRKSGQRFATILDGEDMGLELPVSAMDGEFREPSW